MKMAGRLIADWGRSILNTLLLGLVVVGGDPLHAAVHKRAAIKKAVRQAVPVAKDSDGVAEARLIEIYKLIGQTNNREALAKADRLVEDFPNFQLAQLVHGDLLAAQTRPLKSFGDVPEFLARGDNATLAELREESRRRVRALRERPLAGTFPSQFLAISQKSRHAIAVDASKSRLYLFENTPAGLNLVADYYISVGKAGTAKTAEGDQRTPLGVYYITSNLDPKSLKDFYGSGALPISYPNMLDSKRGKTGSGIWLHGTPPNQFSRPPQATDGCVVLANPDLQHIIRTVEVRTTPVVIASQLQWVAPQSTRAESKPFEDALRPVLPGPWLPALNSVGVKVGYMVRQLVDIYPNHHKVHYWDTCAPQVILEEAGGTFTDWKGNRSITAGESLATNGTLFEPVMGLLHS